MRRMSLPLLSIPVLLGFVAGARAADDDVKAILNKAIKAHGGEDVLAKYKAAQTKTKGKMTIGGLGEVDFHQEVSYMLPDKLKESLHLEIKNQTITVQTLVNGDKISIEAAGKEVEITDAIKDAVKEAQYMMKAVRLVNLVKDAKDYELSLLGEVKVEGKPALGLRISSKGHKDISLFFNKETNLLAKLEHRTTDPLTSKEFTEERIILEYEKNKDGIPQPKKILVKREGEKFIDAEITESKHLEKLDDSEFMK